ncbi:MAG TPA: hypothetical protein VM531_11035 [Sphingomicrobium sp.]|jgi:hypothetical protein|nr:hypothetical protein [Sphingomicrobium sp.]
MPTFNNYSEWGSGIAGVGVHWQGGTIWPPGHGGGTQWLNPDEVMGQKTGGLEPGQPVGLYAHNVRTGVDRLLFGGPIYLALGSGHDHWVLRTVENGVSVVYDSFGRRLHDAGLAEGAMGPDGSYVVKRKYHSAGPFDVHKPDGTTQEILLDACHPQPDGQIVPAHDVADLVNYGQGRFTWRTGAVWHAEGFPVPQPLTSPANWFRYVMIDGELWQMYQMPDWRFVAHPSDDSNGIVINVGDTFRPDEFVQPTGLVEVVWSATPGEEPGNIRLSRFKATDPREPLEPTLPVPDIEDYHRQLPHFAYFTLDADRGYGDYFEEIQHACWCATESDVAKANEQGSWVIAAYFLIRKARKPAMVMVANDYAGAPPLEEQLAEAVPIARELKCGLLAMDEGDWKTIPKGLPVGAYLAFKVFREPDESLDTWRKRALEATARVVEADCHPCWILGCDDRALTLSDALIIETLDAATQIYVEPGSPVRMSGAFSFARAWKDPQGKPIRPGGGIVHPEAWKWCKASAAASDPVVWTEYALPNEEPEPEEPDMAAIAERLKEVFKKTTEIAIQGSTEVALELNEKVNGKRKIKCTNPDGGDEYRPIDNRDWEQSDIGAWERYGKTPTAYVADRGDKVYVYPRV